MLFQVLVFDTKNDSELGRVSCGAQEASLKGLVGQASKAGECDCSLGERPRSLGARVGVVQWRLDELVAPVALYPAREGGSLQGAAGSRTPPSGSGARGP